MGNGREKEEDEGKKEARRKSDRGQDTYFGRSHALDSGGCK